MAPIVNPIGLINGHYECRSFDETIPILTDLLALEVVAQRDKETIMKHPNTGWLFVVHEEGPNASDKLRLNHYGVRVATNSEIDEAAEYLQSKKRQYRIKVDKIQHKHLARSVHFLEPGGNWWEIESYEDAVKQGLGANVSIPWETPLLPDKFPGRGYIPQALTHGTIGCSSLEASRKFYKEVLGLDVVSPVPNVPPRYIKHPSTPWYIVSLEVPSENRIPQLPSQRFTIAVESAAAVGEAHDWLDKSGDRLGVTELGEIKESDGALSFLLGDPDRNWWEITGPAA